MESLLKACESCRKPMNGGVYKAAHVCPHCLHEHAGGKIRRRKSHHLNKAAKPAASPSEQVSPQVEQQPQQKPQEQQKPQAPKLKPVTASRQPGLAEVEEIALEDVVEAVEPAPAVKMARPTTVVLTAKSSEGHQVLEILGEISAESVSTLKLTPDLISNGKFVGTKSEKVKAALMQGQKNALAQLRQKALDQGINLITEVAVKNAVKAGDGQSVSIIVKATGQAARAELGAEACEA